MGMTAGGGAHVAVRTLAAIVAVAILALAPAAILEALPGAAGAVVAAATVAALYTALAIADRPDRLADGAWTRRTVTANLAVACVVCVIIATA